MMRLGLAPPGIAKHPDLIMKNLDELLTDGEIACP
jgi:hypothetical protein